MLDLTTPVGSPDVVLVRLAGDVDLASLPAIEQALGAAIAADVAAVEVDLTDVGFIGVSGINSLVGAANRARGRGLGFRVVGPSSHLRELCGLLEVGDVLGIGEPTCR